jgi:hypothetical protein
MSGAVRITRTEIPMRSTLSLALLAALAAAPAFAQGAPAQQTRKEQSDAALRQHCTTDYFKFCGNIAPDSPEIDRCFARNWASLSPNCRTAIDAFDNAGKGGAKSKGKS